MSDTLEAILARANLPMTPEEVERLRRNWPLIDRRRADRLRQALCIVQDRVFVYRLDAAVLHDHLPIDDDGVDLVAARRIHQVGDEVAHRVRMHGGKGRAP